MKLWDPPLLNRENSFLQEKYFPDRWKMLVCCILLNLTTRKQVDKIITELFDKWPTPEKMSDANEGELVGCIKSLGLSDKRAKTLMRFSKEYLGKWDDVTSLYGIGRYAKDSDEIFYFGRWRETEPHDHSLNKYKNFLIKFYGEI